MSDRSLDLVDKRTGEVLSLKPCFTRHSPCPVCGKPTTARTVSYCLATSDRQTVLCGHTVTGGRQVGEAGRLFDMRSGLPEASPTRFHVKARPPIEGRDFEEIAREAHERVEKFGCRILASELNVSEASLMRLRVGRITRRRLDQLGTRCALRESWTFPMRDEHDNIIGIRLRAGSKKYAITGSHNGLFIPRGLSGSDPLLAVEGPSDTAAALDLGFDAIGRPAALACRSITIAAATGRELVVVADHGDKTGDGVEGARKLAQEGADSLKVRSAKWIYPPNGKDTRECTASLDEWRNAIKCARVMAPARKA